MILSKSFGYALRGVLYVALKSDTQSHVSLGEIAQKLSVPRHFLGKVMKRVVKEGILTSMRGPLGGFCVNGSTLETPLIRLMEITGEPALSGSCILRFRMCNLACPCPMHDKFEPVRQEWLNLFIDTTIGDLLKKEHTDLIRSITIV